MTKKGKGMRDAVEELLAFDPLSEAEKLTGKNYKTDDQTIAIGFALQVQHAERKRAILASSRDTYFGQSFWEYLAALSSLGFEEFYREPFKCKDRSELFMIWFHKGDGILCPIHTYNGETVNAVKMYFNWRPLVQEYPHMPWSGRWTGEENELFFTGDFDAREGMRHRIETMREFGEFLVPWEQQPYLQLCHYGDYHDVNDYTESGRIIRTKTAERFERLPNEIKAVLKPQ